MQETFQGNRDRAPAIGQQDRLTQLLVPVAHRKPLSLERAEGEAWRQNIVVNSSWGRLIWCARRRR